MELKEIEETYRLLFNGVNDAIVVHPQITTPIPPKFIEVNDVMCRRLGYTREELLGMSIGDIDDPECDTSDLPAINEKLQRDGQAIFERVHLARDGRKIPVEINARLFELRGKPAVLSVIRDITERKVAEERLRESEAMLKAIIDTEPECVKLLDAEGNLMMMNRAGLDMLDVDSLDQIKGQCVCLMVASEYQEAFMDLTHRVFQGESGILVFEAVGIKGRHVWLETHAAPFRNKRGEIVALISVTRDITERKAMENALMERTSQLEDLTKNLEHRVREEVAARRRGEEMMLQQSKLAAMGEMIGAIAHQWRQPLNSLGIIVQKIREDHLAGVLDDAAIEKTVRRSMEQIRFMSRTIDDFRDFFRASKKKTRFDAKVAVGDVLSLLSAQLWNNNITYEVRCGVHGKRFTDPKHIEACREAEVETYQNDFKQVALNIINNAKDAILDRRRRTGEQAEGRIEVTFNRTDGNVQLKIEDNGGGIPEGIIGRIFEPYYTTKSPDRGTGIGLYMAKVVIEDNMGGRLSVRNAGGGAEFTIEVRGA